MKKILAMILAGGRGERLYPLTRDRAKPAVPFGGAYRIIDFTISNCINSDIRKVYILTQYKSLSLDRHIQRAWNVLNGRFGEFVYIIHAQQRVNENWYKGTADAIYQNFYTLQQERPDLVLVLSGDHIYTMDYRPMVEAHLRNRADLTVATMEMGKQYSRDFGVVQIADTMQILDFQEKPLKPKTIPGKSDRIMINMGIYIFNTDVLVKRLIENARKPDTQHDFGKNVIPAMLKKDRVFAYPFIDGITKQKGYWRDVGTIDAYYEANIDLLSDDISASLFDPSWPIYTSEKLAAPTHISGFEEYNGTMYGVALNCILARGCKIHRARIEHSVVSPNVVVGEYSCITDSIILDNVTIGKHCTIRRAIIDKGVSIPDNTSIGYDRISDSKKATVTDSGIVVIPKNTAF
ncbi:MAG: glucose-1-phosphate adenylyltransferase [Desulfobacterota bacterium]|nr:glucose-1-phosphate adenylyltransferase [Thermodesulfobacteriota bacterium]